MCSGEKLPYDCDDEKALFMVSGEQQYEEILLQCFTFGTALPISLNVSLFQSDILSEASRAPPTLDSLTADQCAPFRTSPLPSPWGTSTIEQQPHSLTPLLSHNLF